MSDKATKVLLIEDNPGDARLIGEMLAEVRSTVFDLERTERLSAGLKRLAEGGIDVVLVDLSLPDSRGLNTFGRVQAQSPQVPIIVLTGLDDEMLAVKAVRQGAQDYLVKGQVDGNLLVRALRYAIERKRAEEELRESEERYRTLFQHSGTTVALVEEDGTITMVNKEIEELIGYTKEETIGKTFVEFLPGKEKQRLLGYHKARRRGESVPISYEAKIRRKDGGIGTVLVNVALIPGTKRSIASVTDITEREKTEQELKRKSKEIRSYARHMRSTYKALERAYLEIIHALVISVETRDPYTRGHSERVTQYSKEIARKMGLKEKELKNLELACRIHDIGKIGVSDRILLKNGTLTIAEWAEMKMHPARGAEMLTFSEYFKEIIPIVRHHHERWDGKGYPDGLKGEAIPLGARILAVSDTFDAMSSSRPYRDAIDLKKIVRELKDNAGTQLDPQIVDIWLDIMHR